MSPIYGAARVLADGVASLPLQVYIGANSQTQATRWNGPSIFDRPSAVPQTTPYDWVHQAMTSLVLEGNAFGYIATRDGLGFPSTIEWVPPSDVWIDENSNDGDLPNPMQAKYFYKGRYVPTEDWLHIRAFTVAGRVRGISPLRAFAMIVSQGNAMAQYGNDWFANGGFPPGIFKNMNMEVDAEQAEEIKGNLAKSLRSRRPLVIGADWDYTPVKVPPSESQFVQAVQMNATQVAAIYGVPPERIGGTRGDSLTYANQEQQSISFVTDTLRPWLVRLENAFFGILPAKRYVRFNSDAMIKTDLHTRHQVFLLDRQMGLKTNDELRNIDDLPPLPNEAGSDNRPLDVLVAMSRGTAVLPMDSDGRPMDDLTRVVAGLQPTGGPPSGPGTPAQPTGAPGSGPSAMKPATQPAKPPVASQAPTPLLTPPGLQMIGTGGGRSELQPPKRAPKPVSRRVRSLDDAARLWWSPNAPRGVEPPQAYRSEVAVHARRGGVQFRSFDERCLDTDQFTWLMSVLRASEKPEEYVTLSSNGKQPVRAG